jgi:DNA-binding response OmpR family regulator
MGHLSSIGAESPAHLITEASDTQTRFVVSTPAGTIRLDLRCFQAFAGDRLLELTRLQFDLLVYLAVASPRVVPYGELFGNVIHTTYAAGTSLIRVHVTHLRKKLGPQRLAVETVRGRGLRLLTTTAGDDPRDCILVVSDSLAKS